MKHLLSYFRVHFKRTVKSLAVIILTAAVLAFVLVLTASVLIRSDENKTENQKIKIGIVGDLSDSFLQINFLKLIQIDELSLSVDFIEMNEADAKNALKDRDISAYIFVPEKFVTELAAGENVKLSFVMPDNSTDASALIFGETVQIVSPLITESESGIYAMSSYAYSLGKSNVYEKNMELALEYIDILLHRARAVQLKTIGTDSVSVKQYYILGIITYFLFLLGIAAAPLLAFKHTSLDRSLCSKGLKTWQLFMCEYINYSFILYLFCLITGVMLAYFSRLSNIFDASLVLSAFIRLLPFVLMISAIHSAIGELTGNAGTYVIALFVISTGLSYISGGFYPYYFFPKPIQYLANSLPFGLTFKYLRAAIIGEQAVGFLPSLAYAVVFVIISVIFRHRRLLKEAL